MLDPLKQFAITKIIPIQLLGYDISFTNSSLSLLLVVLCISAFLIMSASSMQTVPGKSQLLGEILYNFIAKMLTDNIGPQAVKYVSPIFSLFLLIMGCNLFGLFPIAFTVTSHIAVTFAMAAIIFTFITLFGLFKHKLKFFSLFLPKGTPIIIAPLLFIIELFAYLSRPVSLSIRLAANMMAGHIILKVIAFFVVAIGLFGIAPFALLVLITAFEIFVALLQAYIFTMLTTVYLNDVINLH